MATFGETAANKLRYLLGSNKPSEIPEGFLRLAEDVDTKMASWWEGTLAARPAFGQANRFYYATDNDTLYHDTGAAWELIVTWQAVTHASVGTLYNLNGENGSGSVVLPGVEYELSATRPAMLYFVAGGVVTGGTVSAILEVGGVVVCEIGSGSTQGDGARLLIPPGVKFKFSLSAGGTSAQASVQYL